MGTLKVGAVSTLYSMYTIIGLKESTWRLGQL